MLPFRRSRSRQQDGGPSGLTSATGATPEADVLRLLMVAVARGDEQSFGQLYDILSPLIHGIVTGIVRDPAMSDEVTQEVFLEIWRLAPRYELPRGSVKSWTSTIAHRRAVDRVRSEQSRRDREEREHRMAPPEVDPLSAAISDSIDAKRVKAALAQLTDVQRSAVELAYFGGHTYREVAVLLELPEGTIKTRIRDGLIKLRDHLGVTT